MVGALERVAAQVEYFEHAQRDKGSAHSAIVWGSVFSEYQFPVIDPDTHRHAAVFQVDARAAALFHFAGQVGQEVVAIQVQPGFCCPPACP